VASGRDSLFLFQSFPSRSFSSDDVSETPQERLNVSETSSDEKDHDTSETPQERLNVSETSSDEKDHDTLVEQWQIPGECIAQPTWPARS